MEFPSFNHHHHHNRYVPPPPPTNFSDDRPNLYPHHQQHLLPSLHLPPPPPLAYPSLPPPPPPPIPVPPPPLSYNPHQSHFTFLDAQNPSFSNHGRSSPPQPRFSNQSHRFDYRTDSWSDSHRVPPELTHRNPILPDEHHRRLYSPDPRSENHYKPHVSERVIPSSRYRDENIINGYASRDGSNIVSQEQQVFRGSSNNDDHQGRIIDRYASAQATGCNSRNEDFVEKYEPRYMSNSENERIWDHHGEDSRRIHQMKGKKNEFGNNDGVLFVSGREQSRDYEYESSRVTRVREGREEFKQVQKRSVLLRIGKPNNTNRNRSHDQHFSKAHMVESNNSNFRGKDKDRDHAGKDSSLYVDHRVEGDREHSPVELDVSFKSNALVAKAVVTPSSPVIGNNNTQLRNKKTKRGSEFNSPLKRSGSSSNGLDCPSSSEKAPKQQKLSLKDPVLGQGAATGPLSFRLKKKRKLINFKNSPSVSIFQLAEKDNKSVKGQNKNSPSAESTIPSTLEEVISSKVVSEKDSSEVEKLVSKIDDGLVNDLIQNEVSLSLENDTQQVSTDAKVAGTPISASCGQDQIEIQNCPTESYASFDAFSADENVNMNNESVKIQEMTTSACSDEIINLVPENGNTVGFLDGVSRKKEETLFPEDGTQETPNAITILTGRSYEASEIQSPGEKLQNVNSSIKVISSDEDEIVEIVELNSESVETQRPDHREPMLEAEFVELNFESQKPEDEVVEIVELNSESTDHSTDEIPPSSSILSSRPDEKPGEPIPDMLTSIVSGFPKDETTCNSNLGNNDVNICEKFVPEPEDGGDTSSKTSGIKPSHLSGTKTAATSTSQGLNNKMPIKRPNPTVFATRSSPVFTNSRVNKPPRTWHRSVNNTSSIPRPTKQVGAVQNAYIRSGNTLVRKASPVTTISRSSIYQFNPSGPTPTETRTGAVVRPKTPPLSGYTATKLPESKVLPSSPLEDPETHKSLDEGGTAGKKIEYVKPKSNQLVAATTSAQELDKSSDGYYKRRKNQLVRTLVGDDSVPDVRKAAKGMFKKYRNSRFSSVWTLGAQSLGKDGVSLRQKLRPHLFPWKRTKFWGYASASMHSNSSSSLLSRKLLVSRKREMIYTRSKHGFSLRMSKLLSVGGSGLKWSKSIEKNSKQANEEATLAVAAAEKKRREQQHLKSRNNNNNMSRDRIFRIGLVRYKMDPSRRTLQRISDEEPSTSKSSKEETRRRSYVPKRLLIGHDEYLRIGNGNQLVRNPKRRTCLFANEKVRWSLHTARSRLARKKKYCQFFTRFGKCNKDNDGKCPYIHDSSKIAVCTKFLKGLCSNPHCNLTHKVIPERMQDCSYFLQGVCSNEHCPYRHVNVNSAASVCEAFLKGYCADGNECRKKHTYACPAFEATGECSQGTNCKLHHPKNRSTGLKRKHQNQKTQKHSRGRYFGAVGGGGGEGEEAERQHHFNLKDILCQQGKLGADYISIDFGDGVTDETTVVTSEEYPLYLVGEEEEEAHLDLDHLTKPIGIMKNFNLHTPHMA